MRGGGAYLFEVGHLPQVLSVSGRHRVGRVILQATDHIENDVNWRRYRQRMTLSDGYGR